MTQSCSDARRNEVRRGGNPRRSAHAAPISSKQHRDEIDGVIVTLPNFGDERAIADTLRLAELNVPVLVRPRPTRRAA